MVAIFLRTSGPIRLVTNVHDIHSEGPCLIACFCHRTKSKEVCRIKRRRLSQARKSLELPIGELFKILVVGQRANVHTTAAGVFVASGHGMWPMTKILD
jgi:hypothetical protein